MLLVSLWLLLLVHGDALRSSFLLGIGFLRRHSLINPLVRRFQVGGALVRQVALPVRLFAVQQIYVCHGIVIVLAQLQSFVERINTILYYCAVPSNKLQGR